MTEPTYLINEVFLTLQGEGVRSGTANVFVRFSGCNLRCEQAAGPRSPGGFDCDTEFVSGRRLTLSELMAWITREAKGCPWVLFTGGEPGLQLDAPLIDACHQAGFQIAIETNGSVALPEGIDWITVSPKVAEHAIRQRVADEVKYVRAEGQAIPSTTVTADNYLVSPATSGLSFDPQTVRWCERLCLEHPTWRLSLQAHKLLNIR